MRPTLDTRGMLPVDPWLELHWLDIGGWVAWWWTTSSGVAIGPAVVGRA